MASLKQSSSSSFGYPMDMNTGTADNPHPVSLLSVLEVYVHCARNIHNICIYDNQDVYAKFSLTYNPDDTISTRIIHRAGKNPEFNEKLMINVSQMDSVLKCEIWMMSRARHYMEDQLLGFVLVPLSDIIGKDKVTRDYSLSSTDLFHSPAGTIKLTLSIIGSSSPSITNLSVPKMNTSISSEVVLLDPQGTEVGLDPVLEYTRIEFPDVKVVNENKKMVTEYFNGLNLRQNTNQVAGFASFLCLGSTHTEKDSDTTMVLCSEENNGSFQNSEFLMPSSSSSSTTTSLSDDRNTADSNDKKNQTKHQEEMRNKNKNKTKEMKKAGGLGQLVGEMNTQAEEMEMQKQIVDMYMRSMQQFTESLSNMRLPMNLQKQSLQHEQDHTSNNNAIQIQNTSNRLETEKKKDGSRVFYGSRAFF